MEINKEYQLNQEKLNANQNTGNFQNVSRHIILATALFS